MVCGWLKWQANIGASVAYVAAIVLDPFSRDGKTGITYIRRFSVSSWTIDRSLNLSGILTYPIGILAKSMASCIIYVTCVSCPQG